MTAREQEQEKLLEDYVRRLQISHDRYEYVRRLNPRQFTELYQAHISGDVAFDDLVDQRIEAKRT